MSHRNELTHPFCTRGCSSKTAAAIVSDVRTADGDAIKVDLEHKDGQAPSVLLPYHTTDATQHIKYGQLD
jgi:hypothetical protein